MTEQEKKIAELRAVLARISFYIKSKKLDVDGSCLTKEATLGFNLACDFIADDLIKLQNYENKDILDIL